MCLENYMRPIPDEDEKTLHVTPIARSFKAMFEGTYTSRGGYQINGATALSAK